MRFLLIPALALCATAQDVVKLLDWDKLAAKAKETTNINLDGNMLGLAKNFLGDKGDEAKAKGLMEKLKGVYIRSLEFSGEGEYSMADVDAARNKLTSMNWSPIVDVKSKKETTGIYVKTDGKTITGLVILAAEPRELTLINIAGNIDPSELQALGGKFGIPNIHMQGGGKSAAKGSKDDEE